ncbi:MAG: hydrogenase [Candidatus Eisenbacteria bacterium]|nr:hydrogenase [Candidatus Eisenbacteria bacterium]
MSDGKLKIGVYELTGCAGDALMIVDCEDELLDIFQAVDVQSFAMAKSDNVEGQLDVALVEGSVTTRREIEELKDIRQRTKVVVAFGSCATVGGIQARFSDPEVWQKNYRAVFGNTEFPHAKAMPSKPIDAFIDVDFYLPGCPVSKEQLLNLLTRIIGGNPPEDYPQPVCVTCKYRENDCLLTRREFCLGPLIADGCGAVCPSHNLPCVGCWGPVKGANVAAGLQVLMECGFSLEEAKQRLSNYSGARARELLAQLERESR